MFRVKRISKRLQRNKKKYLDGGGITGMKHKMNFFKGLWIFSLTEFENFIKKDFSHILLGIAEISSSNSWEGDGTQGKLFSDFQTFLNYAP